MNLSPEMEFDWKAATQDIILAIKYHFSNTNSRTGVIGLSGGVDSAVTAAIATRALGKQNIIGLILPERGVTPKEDLEDAIATARILGIKHKTIEISEGVRSITAYLPELSMRKGGRYSTPIAFGNVKARLRMILLYAVSNMAEAAQVLGTGDKSELLLGYSTKHGDHGVDLLPIGDLYKSQVRFLIDKIGLPSRIGEKEPSPSLLKGQQAKGELGVGYEDIDRILYYRVEQRYSAEHISDHLKIPRDIVEKLMNMIMRSHHKRKSPPICKISSCTINWDWRMPIE